METPHMKLFITNKGFAEKEIGIENLKLSHQICYKELQKDVLNYKIPFNLFGEYNEHNEAMFGFIKVDWEKNIFYYEFQNTIGGF